MSKIDETAQTFIESSVSGEACVDIGTTDIYDVPFKHLVIMAKFWLMREIVVDAHSTVHCLGKRGEGECGICRVIQMSEILKEMNDGD